MKLRIKGNSIRLRLSRTEVADFAVANAVSDAIQFAPSNGSLRYSLKMDEATDAPRADFVDGSITITVPRTMGADWAADESRVGMEHTVELTETQESLRILVEKDFQCLAERPDEDESDNFPHPVGRHEKNC